MDLDTKGFSALLSAQAAAAQSAHAQRNGNAGLLDFSVGSIFRALAEANATIGLWLQSLILKVLTATRASTSSGADLDSWMADYGLSRSAATFAAGNVTFSRFTPVLPALVPVNTMVRTADGSQSFLVVADTAHPRWNVAQNGFVIPQATPSADIPVRAITAGSPGNVGSGTISLLATATPGVDTVTNALPMTGGTDSETDEAFRARFTAYLSSLSRATRLAISFAISQVQPGLTWTIIERQTADGAVRDAHFDVVVDDGTGSPGAPLLAAVAASVEAYRPVGVTYAVLAPQTLTANVALTVTTLAEADHAEVVADVAGAVTDYIASLPLGAGLPYTRIAQVAYATSSAVTNVTGVTLNGGTADLAAAPRRVIRPGTVAVA